MKRFTRGDSGLKLLSLLLAVVLWIYVANEQNPPQEREFRGIAVEARGLGSHRSLLEPPGTVNFKVQANQKVISELSAKSFQVFVDLSTAANGRNVLPVQIKGPGDVKVTGLSPQTLTLVVDPLEDKQVPLKVKYIGKLHNGFRVQSVKTKPDEVILRGPKSILDSIVSASVDMALRGKSKSFGETVPVRVTDKSGRFIEEKLVKRSPQVVDVSVTIAAEKYTKTVKVVPNIIGQPAQGKFVVETTVDPASVVIAGERSVIDGISQVQSPPVDITDTNKDIVLEGDLVPPAGVTINAPTVKVTVKIGQE